MRPGHNRSWSITPFSASRAALHFDTSGGNSVRIAGQFQQRSTRAGLLDPYEAQVAQILARVISIRSSASLGIL